MNVTLNTELYQVTSNYFCAGLVVSKTGLIKETAPILRKAAAGKNFYQFCIYCNARGWRIRKVQFDKVCADAPDGQFACQWAKAAREGTEDSVCKFDDIRKKSPLYGGDK